MANSSREKERLTIRQKIKGEKCRILKQKSLIHRRRWRQVGLIYQSREVDPNFIDSPFWKKDPELLEKMRRKSREILDQKYSKKTHNLYLMAKKWCVVPHTLKFRAFRIGFTFLNMDPESNKDLEIWEMRIKDYTPQDNEINLIPLLRMNDPKISMEKKIKNLKITAKKLINLMNYDDYSEEAWNTIIRWFTKRRPYREISLEPNV